jgi:sulfur relay protein TusB/DsrH
MDNATLHLVQQSASASSALRDCLASCQPADPIVLMHDAVYAALSKPADNEFYALRPDLEERGLLDRIDKAIHVIDYPDLVALSDRYRHNLSWF